MRRDGCAAKRRRTDSALIACGVGIPGGFALAGWAFIRFRHGVVARIAQVAPAEKHHGRAHGREAFALSGLAHRQPEQPAHESHESRGSEDTQESCGILAHGKLVQERREAAAPGGHARIAGRQQRERLQQVFAPGAHREGVVALHPGEQRFDSRIVAAS